MLRQIFLLTTNSLTAYQYSGGRLEHMARFVGAEAGLAYFDDYLQHLGQAHTTVLTDLTEEDFRTESVVHTLGADRKALLERNAARVYRGTEYRHAQILGRDPQNRRKDEVLFSALLNPELADMWLEAMAHHKVPIAGVHSLSLLSATLLKRLCPGAGDALLVTDNKESGLRQSFFKNGKLRFSRLTPVPDQMADANYSDFVHAEIGKTKRYLSNLHLLGRDVRLGVCMLSSGARLIELNRMREAESLTHYNLLDVAEVAKKIGYRGPLPDSHCDHLFAYLHAKTHTPNHYAKKQHRFHFQIYRARQALALVGVAATVGGVLWTGTQIVDSLLQRDTSAKTEQLISIAAARYEEAKSRIPHSDVAPEDVSLAVELADRLQQQRRSPRELLAGLGQAIQEQPTLVLDKIDYFIATDRNATEPPSAEATQNVQSDTGDGTETVSEDVSAGSTGQFQIGIVRGRITRFAGDYRSAHQMIDRLLVKLRATRGVLAAEALELPLNIAPGGSVQGGVDKTAAQLDAGFAVRLVMGEEHARL